ncbi:DUF2281 domain-containing protein [Dyadobacter sandarakinus]|uniref:DUF2281 domain-containing protein n=1 Tax=Dyadobacter sandarakinus TaxID=2747268 RepID=A0ABX7IBH5_9BACT|nr:DUF2281 domain-containing protein [Dyadobacter sandarakinus]QRR03284.1 DUF2281 domain-containing protein [Dyadobacter sandarakinus]
MWTTIGGVYENGKVILSESPPDMDRAKVLITFLGDNNEKSKKRVLGTMKGTIQMSDDFNEPLDDLKDYM